MLAAELRYAACMLAILAGVMAAVALAVIFGRFAHLSPELTTVLALLIMCGGGFAAVVLWRARVLRNGRIATGSPACTAVPAVYAPIIISSVVLAWWLYSIAKGVPLLFEGPWQHGVDTLVLPVMFAVSSLYTIRLVLAQARGKPPRLSPLAERRIQQLRAARALSDIVERRRAMRPIVVRGYIRLGLIVGSPILTVALVGRLGIALALLVSLACFAAIFGVLRWVVDL
ncbi:MAG: hypothetical protein ABR591_04880 [Candidatus Velthaea sp.]